MGSVSTRTSRIRVAWPGRPRRHYSQRSRASRRGNPGHPVHASPPLSLLRAGRQIGERGQQFEATDSGLQRGPRWRSRWAAHARTRGTANGPSRPSRDGVDLHIDRHRLMSRLIVSAPASRCGERTCRASPGRPTGRNQAMARSTGARSLAGLKRPVVTACSWPATAGHHRPPTTASHSTPGAQV
jgi:hypothetical protein